MNKRKFVLATGGSVLAGCGGSALAGMTGPGGPATLAAEGTLAAWRGRVGERFEVFGGDAAAALELQGVRTHACVAGIEQFSLMFVVTGVAPAGATQVLRQAGRQPLALFLDQAGQTASGAVQLRADCCRLV